MRYLQFTLVALAACSAPTVVVDTSAPTVTMDGADTLSTGSANVYTISASAEGRSIHRIGLEASLSGSTRRASVGATARDSATVCVRLDPAVDCAGYDLVLELPADFGRDGNEVELRAIAHDDGPARRLGQSAPQLVTVRDTTPPVVTLSQPPSLQPDRSLALRVRIFDRHSGAGRLSYRLRLLSNRCVATEVSGELSSFMPDGDHELAILALSVPPGLSSGDVRIESLEVLDAAATPNRAELGPTTLCIGSCGDQTPPDVEIVSVHHIVEGAAPVALEAGDGVPPGATLDVRLRARDEASALRNLWTLVGDEPPAPPADLQTCPGLPDNDEQTQRVTAPVEVDGFGFQVLAGAYDDVGQGGDHNLGQAPPFALVVRDEAAPTIDAVVILDADGAAQPSPPVGGSLRVGVTAHDTFGKIARLQVEVVDQDGRQAGISEIEELAPAQPILTDYASPTLLQLPNPNDRRATADWTLRVTLWDDATPANSNSITLPFQPTDRQAPNITQISGGGAINISNGRAATVRISGNDTARFLSRAALTELAVGQTGVAGANVTVNLPANTAEITQQAVTIAIPGSAREGLISARPQLVDDRGNLSTAEAVSFNLVDDVPPQVQAVFNPNILVPGGSVRLEVEASDINSQGIASIAVAPTQHIAWNNAVVSNASNAVFTGTVSENPGVIGAGLPLSAVVTVTDRAAGANQTQVSANATIRDEAGPIITIIEVPDAVSGGSSTLRIRARDLNGEVASTGYSLTLRRYDAGEVIRQQTVSYGRNERAQSINQEFTVGIPADIEEGDYSIIFSATDSEGNLSQVTSVGQHRLTVRDTAAPTGLSFRSPPGHLATSANAQLRVRADDVASGIARLSLRATGAGVDATLHHDCAGTPRLCEHTFSLPIPAAAVHAGLVTLTLTARDGAAAPNSASVNTEIPIRDVDAPINLSFSNPLPVNVDTGGSLVLQLNAQDESSGLSSASFTVPCGSVSPVTFDNSPTAITAFSATWSVPANCPEIGAGTVRVVVADGSGHSANSSATLAVTVRDATAPVVSFRSPPETANTGDSVTIRVRINDRESGAENVTLTTSCGTLSVGGRVSFPGNPTGNSDHSFVLAGTAACPPGTVTLTLNGTDAAGNAAAAVQHQLTMADDDPPTLTIITADNSVATVGATLDLTVSAQDLSSGLASITMTVPCGTLAAPHPISFNGETTQQQVTRTWTLPADCRSLGAQTVTVVAADNSGASNDATATVSITVQDTTAPTAAWVNPAANVNLSTALTLTAQGEDPSSGIARFIFTVDNGAQGSFSPASIAVAGAPTSDQQSSDLSVDSALLHGATVAVTLNSQDVAGNTSAAAQTQLTVVDDIAPTAITATPQLAGNRALPGGRWAVGVNETVTIDLSASDANSGIATLNLNVSQGGQSMVVGDAAGAGASPFTTSENITVMGQLGDGDLITITPRADDVSEATGFTNGSDLVLVVDGAPPADAVTLTAPSNATIFGDAQSFGCLTAGNTTVSGTAGADAVAVMVNVMPAPAGFPMEGLMVPVVAGTWSFTPDGYFWPNLTELMINVRAMDAVGNVQPLGTDFMLRGDTANVLWAPGTTVQTSASNATSGRADFQPVLDGPRSQSTGGSHVVRGRFTCGEASSLWQADDTPLMPTFSFTEPNTLSLGEANSATCSYELEESFCSRIHTASGSATMAKVNAAPVAATAQEVEADNSNPATIDTPWPSFSGQFNDPFDAQTNQITQSGSAQFRVYTAGGSPIWTSAMVPVSVADGGTASVTFPTWRPFNAGVVSGAGIALRRANTVLWFPTGSANPTVHVLNLVTNTWSGLSQNAIGGIANWALTDAVALRGNGNLIRITGGGTVLTGAVANGSITWTSQASAGSPPQCSSRRLTRAWPSAWVLWCRAVDNQASPMDETGQLHSYYFDQNGNGSFQTALLNASSTTVAADFQAIRLRHATEAHFRVLPGTGVDVQPLGAELGILAAWATAPTATGEVITTAAGASIAATGTAMEYIMVDGASGGWLVSGDATPSSDSAASFTLPGGINVGGTGHHLADGDANVEAVLLSFASGLRPMQWIPADDNFALPPDPNSGEEALQYGVNYSWDLRFVDEGAAAGSFLGAGSDQAFVYQVN